jgi:hypothetical protein
MSYRTHWWKKDRNKVHSEVVSVVDRLEKQLNHERRYADWLSLLLNRRYSELTPGKINFGTEISSPKRRLAINVINNIMETLTSRVCTRRPRPRFITVDGNWSDKRKAQKLDRFVEGVFHQAKVYRETTKAFRDAAWTGTGFIKVCQDPVKENEVLVERVFPFEILVDQQACIQGQAPRTLYQVKWVPVEVLEAAYPKRRTLIEKCAKQSRGYDEGAVVATDLVRVIEAWHVSSGGRKEDGRHAITIDNCTLYDRKYPHDYLPFAVLRWADLPVGFYGQGLVELQAGTQEELNKMMARMQDAAHLFAKTTYIVPEGAVKDGALRNLTGDIVKCKPGFEDQIKVHAPQIMHGQVFQLIDWLYDKPHETSGVSQMSATGEKTPGIEAAVAIREVQDIETNRQGQLYRSWENLHLDIAELTTGVARDMYRHDDPATDYQVRYAGKQYYQAIKWSEVNLEKDAYVLQLWPTNLLPSSPAGKLATAEELMATGMVDKQTAQALLDFPDVEKSTNLAATTIDMVDYVVEKVMDGNPPPPPTMAMDLPTSIRRLGYHVLQAQMDQAPEDVQASLRAYMEAVTNLAGEVQEAREALDMVQEMQAQAQAPPTGEAQIPQMEAPVQ